MPKTPDLPMEAAELRTRFAVLSDRRVLVSSACARPPIAPLPEMFAAARRSGEADR
ncbi:hypothetical protein [Nocardiopsis sp. CC223A]|uniref:hypothetical protein n=1 Tax=Nocardiopsis sp. CC223A TaxID=3044051 RepID=UPI00278C4DB4|nr:hypothetical protein [Nocardiopsis sp. CC223A]